MTLPGAAEADLIEAREDGHETRCCCSEDLTLLGAGGADSAEARGDGRQTSCWCIMPMCVRDHKRSSSGQHVLPCSSMSSCDGGKRPAAEPRATSAHWACGARPEALMGHSTQSLLRRCAPCAAPRRAAARCCCARPHWQKARHWHAAGALGVSPLSEAPQASTLQSLAAQCLPACTAADSGRTAPSDGCMQVRSSISRACRTVARPALGSSAPLACCCTCSGCRGSCSPRGSCCCFSASARSASSCRTRYADCSRAAYGLADTRTP